MFEIVRIPKRWLNKQLTIVEAEAWQSWHLDARLDGTCNIDGQYVSLRSLPEAVESVKSTHEKWKPIWQQFVSKMVDGDELWFYDDPTYSIIGAGMDIGFAIVRNSEVLAAVRWLQLD